ncbi:MAG TPA: M28 family peptidase [Gemmatimonadaceae bacterium]|nr:M28 family peptidase [Gemmatimonadaceae bacterium]
MPIPTTTVVYRVALRSMFAGAGLLVAIGCHANASQRAPIGADSTAIRRDIEYLASDSLEGRGTGTAGNDSAAAYIARRYQALGLGQLCLSRISSSSCERGWLQRFNATSVAATRAGLPGELPTQNVVAVIAGSDPRLRGEYVVLGAHYDHLGRGRFGALDADRGSEVRNGADDNASGTVAVMELARLLESRPPRRSVVLAHFSGEELGLLGSREFVNRSPVPIDSVVAMVNFDMVGRMRGDKLIVYGTGTAAELPAIVDSANVAGALALRTIPDGFGPSDHSSFYAKGIPVLHLFTDLHEDYHRATDDADKINVAGTMRVIEYAERLTRLIADAPTRLTPVRSPAPAPVASSGRGYGAYFGSIPDMGAGDVKGVRVSGVREGSPADSAGVREGDVIVQFGGKPVNDLYEFTDVLRAHKPGDTVDVVVERSGQRVTLKATLRSRG